MSDRAEATELLKEVTRGTLPPERLMPLVYDELRRLAESYLRSGRSNQTIQATELVHEAYLRLVDQTRVQWENRAHFFAVAATVMRRILVDRARRRGRKKRGGGYERLALEEALVISAEPPATDLIALDIALTRLGETDPEKARVVEMHFFAGLTNREIARVLDLTPRTISRYWNYAQAWLYREMLRPN